MKIIIASHGDYSAGILDSVNVIFGGSIPHEITTYSLHVGEDVINLVNNISSSINNDELTIILTDLLGGSVDNALFHLVNKKNVQIITGINLPLVLEIMTLKDIQNLDDDINTIIENSRNSLVSKNILSKSMQYNSKYNDDLDLED